MDETTKLADVDLLLAVLNGGAAPAFTAEGLAPGASAALGQFARKSAFMTQVRMCVFVCVPLACAARAPALQAPPLSCPAARSGRHALAGAYRYHSSWLPAATRAPLVSTSPP